jgi:hypothetical protein
MFYAVLYRSSGFHAALGSPLLTEHIAHLSHNFYLKPGHPHPTRALDAEVYCGSCGDFKYSSVFDGIVKRKRPLPMSLSMDPSSSAHDMNTASVSSASRVAEEKYKRSARRRKGRGICNMGSTCFLSAVLQVLMHINLISQNKQMQDSFVSEYPCNDTTIPAEGGGGCVVCELRNVFEENSVDVT